ncbi:unnamed protein product [Discosporangium mesarthrocarpum]
MSATAKNPLRRSKKRTRSRPREARKSAWPDLYGPVTCTLSASVLVQGYLSFKGSAPEASSVDTTVNDTSIRSTLHVSEARFDMSKRRFGGHAKRVNLVDSLRGEGVVLGETARIVATQEALHSALHCRCVFILIRELITRGRKGSRVPSQQGEKGRSTTSMGKGTASSAESGIQKLHLVTLSPNDVFTALSVESFCITTTVGSGGGAEDSGFVEGVETSTELEALAIVDGPAVIRKPGPSLPGEPWQGMEFFSGSGSRPWTSQRLHCPGSSEGQGLDKPMETLHGGAGRQSVSGTRSFRWNENLHMDLSGGARCFHPKRHRGPALSAFILSHEGSSFVSPCPQEDTGRNSGDRQKRGRSNNSPRCGETPIAILALRASPAMGTGLERFHWAALSTGGWAGAGMPALSPWRCLPEEWQDRLTCICPAPRGSISAELAVGDVVSGTGWGLGNRLKFTEMPPMLYAGARLDDPGHGVAQGSGVRVGGGGVLLELCGGVLSRVRLLPAPPVSVEVALVDDGEGVVVVLLEDHQGTALLLACDGNGSDLPVEEYRGVGQVYVGDFLGTGREQVALLPMASTATGSAGVIAPGRPIASSEWWEQASLKAMVKGAVVTDCSCVWGRGYRDDLAALPGAPPIHLSRGGGGGGGGRSDDSKGTGVKTRDGCDPGGPGGRKRQRQTGPELPPGGSCQEDSEAGPDSGSGLGEGEEIWGATTARRVSSGSGVTAGGGVGADEGGDARLSRLFSVAGVLRQRLRAEEIRLLGLKRASREKAALLVAAREALGRMVYSGDTSGGIGAGVGEGRREGQTSPPCRGVRGIFEDGLIPCFGAGTPPSNSSILPPPARGPFTCPLSPHGNRATEWGHDSTLRCSVIRLDFHAPSRTLCVDARVENPIGQDVAYLSALVPGLGKSDGAAVASVSDTESKGSNSAGPEGGAACVCLGMLVEGGRVLTQSAVCPYIGPGAATTIRARAEVPPCLLNEATGAALLYLSSSWVWERAEGCVTRGEMEGKGTPHSVIFASVRLSPRDMLGIGSLGLGMGLGPVAVAGGGHSRTAAAGAGAPPAGLMVDTGATAGGAITATECYEQPDHDVGARLDILVQSHTSGLESLPQAVRCLSTLLALPEPWAGGARATVASARAAEVTLRAGAPGATAAILLRAVVGFLPEGVTAGPLYGSREALDLLTMVVRALQRELSAIDDISRRMGRGDKDGGWGRIEDQLVRYAQAQNRTDLLMARVAGCVVAAGGWDSVLRIP